MAANDDVQTKEEATVYVKQLDLFVKVMLLEETPAVLSLGTLCEDHGYAYHWISGRKPHLTKKGKRIVCNISNYVPFVVPGLSTSSSTNVFLHHFHHRIPYLMSTDTPKIQSNKEVESTSEELRGNPLHRPTETENKNKNEESEEVQSDLWHDLPDWLQEFKENLVDERISSEYRGNPELGYRDTSKSSHELPMGS